MEPRWACSTVRESEGEYQSRFIPGATISTVTPVTCCLKFTRCRYPLLYGILFTCHASVLSVRVIVSQGPICVVLTFRTSFGRWNRRNVCDLPHSVRQVRTQFMVHSSSGPGPCNEVRSNGELDLDPVHQVLARTLDSVASEWSGMGGNWAAERERESAR
jgi:hypothetical protein